MVLRNSQFHPLSLQTIHSVPISILQSMAKEEASETENSLGPLHNHHHKTGSSKCHHATRGSKIKYWLDFKEQEIYMVIRCSLPHLLASELGLGGKE